MKMSSILTVAILSFALASAAHAGDDKSQAAAVDSKAPAPMKEKKICRTERVTGSLTQSSRICMTQAEWDALAVQTSKDVGDISRKTQIKNTGPFGG